MISRAVDNTRVSSPSMPVVIPHGAYSGLSKVQRAVLLLLAEEGKVRIVQDEEGDRAGDPVRPGERMPQEISKRKLGAI